MNHNLWNTISRIFFIRWRHRCNFQFSWVRVRIYWQILCILNIIFVRLFHQMLEIYSFGCLTGQFSKFSAIVMNLLTINFIRQQKTGRVFVVDRIEKWKWRISIEWRISTEWRSLKFELMTKELEHQPHIIDNTGKSHHVLQIFNFRLKWILTSISIICKLLEILDKCKWRTRSPHSKEKVSYREYKLESTTKYYHRNGKREHRFNQTKIST